MKEGDKTHNSVGDGEKCEADVVWRVGALQVMGSMVSDFECIQYTK